MLGRIAALLKRFFGPREAAMLPSTMAMDPAITRVYYFPVDAKGNETGEPVEIALAADGTADVSKLPPAVRSRLETVGVRDELGMGTLLPKDGSRFLAGLLRSATGYTRFRTSPERAKASSV